MQLLLAGEICCSVLAAGSYVAKMPLNVHETYSVLCVTHHA